MSAEILSPIGSLPVGWKLEKLVNITTKIGSGSTPRGGDSAYLSERVEFAFVRSQNVLDFHFNESEIKYISNDDSKKLKGVHLQKNDILLNITGDEVTFGRSCIVPENILPAAVNQHVTIIRVNPELCLPGYLLAYLCLPIVKEYISSFNAGGSRRAITKAHIESFDIPIAPRHIQLYIEKITFDYLNKINLNTQTNQTLESIAQAIFKSWFVDFEPVKAKMAVLAEGGTREQAELAAMGAISGKGEAELAQLQQQNHEHYQQLAETAALFPSAMVESELGEIPEGWGVKALDEIAHYQNGLALQNFRPDSDDYLPVLKIAQLKKGYADGEEKASPSIKPECIVDNSDVVFSWSGSLMVDVWCGGKVALNQHLFKVTSKTHPKWAYYYFTKHHLADFQRIASDKAVTMGHIKREHLSDAKCALPKSDNLSSFTKYIEPLIEKQVSLRLEKFKLAELRDSLLPKLLSGEIDLSDIQSEVA